MPLNDKPLSQADETFLFRWFTRNLAVLIGSATMFAMSVVTNSPISASINYVYMMITVALLIVAPGSSEQKGSTEWAKDNLYMVFVMNGFAFFITAAVSLMAISGIGVATVSASLLVVYVITKIVMRFHDAWPLDAKETK